jgi:membrane fusion protein (multidrug efflux system)
MANITFGTADMGEEKPRYGKRLLIGVGLVILLVIIIIAGKVGLVFKQMSSFKPPPPPTVSTAAATMQDWSNKFDTVGSLRAWRGTDLSTEIAGLVRSVHFRSGESVAEGQVLVELNADAEKAQLQSLQAVADLARTVLKRDKEQLAVSAVAQATIDADEADLKNKLAQVDQQKALVDKKTIRAPFAGRTGITTVMPGQYLNAGDKVVTLQSIDSLFVDFNVPQRELGRVTVGSDVGVSVDSWPQRSFSGKVTAISSAVDTTTRNVQVEATLKNPKHELLPGMFTRVALMVGSQGRYITIPQSAVTYNPYGSTVFIAEKPGKDDASKGGDKDKGAGAPPPADSLVAKQVFVTTGSTRGDQVAILKGLQEGDVVVTSGQLKLKNGGTLAVDNKVKPLDDASPTPQEN